MSTRPYIFAIGREDPQNSPVPAALPLTAAPRCAKGSGDCCTCERRDPDRRGGDETPQLSGHDPDAPRLLGRAPLCASSALCHAGRSEARRVGKGGVLPCTSRLSSYPSKKKNTK